MLHTYHHKPQCSIILMLYTFHDNLLRSIKLMLHGHPQRLLCSIKLMLHTFFLQVTVLHQVDAAHCCVQVSVHHQAPHFFLGNFNISS